MINSILNRLPILNQYEGLWGLYDAEGNAIAEFTRFYSFDRTGESRITEYPVEEGAFASANKVNSSATIRVALAKDGNWPEISAAIDAIEAARLGTALLTVTTPFKTYAGYNLVRFDYGHKDDISAYTLAASLNLQEVRSRPAAYTTMPAGRVKDPSAASTVERGRQQPAEPNKSVLKQAEEWVRENF